MKTEHLKHEDVISLVDMKAALKVKPQQTFRVSELAQALVFSVTGDELQKKWATDGVACEVLTASSGWRKGKVRISAEFIPSEDEAEGESVDAEICAG